MVRFLAGLGLSQYQDALLEWGYDTIERLSLIEYPELLELGMKRGHAKSFKIALLTEDASGVLGSSSSSAATTPSSQESGRSRSGSGRSVEDLWRVSSVSSASGGSGQAATHQPFRFKVIPSAALVVKELVGRGSFGDVHKCEYQGGTCAVKRIKRFPESARESLTNKEILKEAEAMEICKNHPHVLVLYGVCLDANDIMFVTEFCEHGSLHDAVVKPREPAYSLTQTLRLARQGVSGLVHLHSLGPVIHRDIAARNMLLTASNTVKVCDFGLAKIKTTTSKHTSYSTSNINPLRWAAPESLTLCEYSTASDVYMCGVCLWELWMRRTPFEELDNLQAALQVAQGARPAIEPASAAAFPGLAGLIRRCWNPRKDERPSMDTVMGMLGALIDEYEAAGVGTEAQRPEPRAPRTPRPITEDCGPSAANYLEFPSASNPSDE